MVMSVSVVSSIPRGLNLHKVNGPILTMNDYVKDFILKTWGVKDRFPGPQPISIEFKHFPILRNNDYVVCEKTDGVRHMMVALMYEGKKQCVFVNRNFQMFSVPLHFKKSIFDGTILDGELCGDTFLVYDAVMVEGKIIGHENFLGRLDHMERVTKGIIGLKSDRVKVRLKKFHIMKEFKYFMNEYLPTVKEPIDGLVFTPVNEQVLMGTHETMFKWKPKEKNTIDFLAKVDDRGVWRLYVQEKGKLYMEGEIPADKVAITPLLEDGAILECMYMENDTPMWWKPLLKREDKNYPNNRRTFYRTLVNIKEDIKMNEFLKCT